MASCSDRLDNDCDYMVDGDDGDCGIIACDTDYDGSISAAELNGCIGSWMG